MKSLSLAAAVSGCLLLGACSPASKTEEAPKDTITVQNKDAQTMLAIKGFWRMPVASESDFSSIPTPYAFEINDQGLLIFHRFDLSSRSSTRAAVGTVNAISENYGEVLIDPALYLAYRLPEIQARCGRSFECQKDAELGLRESLTYNVTSWTLSGGSLSFSGLLHGLGGQKASGDAIEKTRRDTQRKLEASRATAQRVIKTAPLGVLPLKKITVVAGGGQPVNHVIGSDLTYECGGQAVVVPNDIKDIQLHESLVIGLNSAVSARLDYLRATSVNSFQGFTFWNPYRCNERSCSQVIVALGDSQVSLIETINGCLQVEYNFNTLPN